MPLSAWFCGYFRFSLGRRLRIDLKRAISGETRDETIKTNAKLDVLISVIETQKPSSQTSFTLVVRVVAAEYIKFLFPPQFP
jgi:hypothetical protein